MARVELVDVTNILPGAQEAVAGAHAPRGHRSGIASGAVHGTPKIIIDGVMCRGEYDARAVRQAVAGRRSLA
jgi:hypothetical protein